MFLAVFVLDITDPTVDLLNLAQININSENIEPGLGRGDSERHPNVA
jgi:hypothetical protein